MAAASATTVLRRSLVGPPHSDPAAPTEQALTLTYFDMIWLHFHPIQRLLFYNFPCSKSQFLEDIVPSFEGSLSKTLRHYLPLSGTLYYPTRDDSGMPQLRYKPGDSVSVTAAEYSGEEDSDEYFNYLAGNSQRDCDKFYPFFPDLPDPKTEPDFQTIPLLAVQITLFPGVGICLGFNNDHVAGDASSIVRFIKAWSRVAKFGADDEVLASKGLLPFYDRSVVEDPKGLRNAYWDLNRKRTYGPRPSIAPKGKVRATYVLQETDIKKLKKAIQSKKPNLTHISSFTVTTAYVWTCLAKSSSDEKLPGNEPEHFAFAVDARSRFDPPVPEEYFGNVIGAGFVETTHGELRGEDGFFAAAQLIGDVISEKVTKKGEFLRDSEDWLPKFFGLAGKRLFGVAGSPKFDLYDVDFGWGKPKKYEAVGIDGDGSISLCKSVEFQGGLEIGLSCPRKKMNAFDECFYGGLAEM